MACPRMGGGSTLGLASGSPAQEAGCLLKTVPVQAGVEEGPASESSQERSYWIQTQDREGWRGFQNISVSLFPGILSPSANLPLGLAGPEQICL